jgi:hypothetical protein
MMTLSKLGIAVALILSLAGCGRERSADRAGSLPVGGAAMLETALRRALHGAEPGGVVLVVLWTVAAPPTIDVRDLAKRWAPHGLVALGICVEPLSGDSRDASLARVHAWERNHSTGIPSLIYDGDAAALAGTIEGAGPRPGLVLLEAQGGRLWSGEGFGDLDALEAVLQAHLGEPNVADGCTCVRIVSGVARAGWAGEPPPRES